MNETTTQPAQAGREKCAAACGRTWKYYVDSDCSPMSCHSVDTGDDDQVWCSRACRDARLPPIAPPAPAPARERRPVRGDRLEWISTGDRYTVLSCDGTHVITRRDGSEHDGGFSLKEPGVKWRFVTDAPAMSEPGRALCSTCMSCPCRCPAARPAQAAAKARPAVPSDDDMIASALRAEMAKARVIERFIATNGRPPLNKAGERLPRTRLTHSAMWADECEDA